MMATNSFVFTAMMTAVAVVAVSSDAVWAPRQGTQNYDLREEKNLGVSVEPTRAQRRAEARLRKSIPALVALYDEVTGVARTLFSADGYLASGRRAADKPPPTIARRSAELFESSPNALRLSAEDRRRSEVALAEGLAFVQKNRRLLGLVRSDLQQIEVVDASVSSASGAARVFLRQRFGELSVYNAQLQLNVNRDGRLISVNNAFAPRLKHAVKQIHPTIDACAAVESAIKHLGSVRSEPPATKADPSKPVPIADCDLSVYKKFFTQPIEPVLMLLPLNREEIRLVWNFQLYLRQGDHVYDINVDAATSEVITRYDWVDYNDYEVYAVPDESPNHSAGRVVLTDPQDAVAAPFGWHDTNNSAGNEFTIMRGNNVHAYEDGDDNDLPPAVQPDCGPLIDCEFPLDLTLAPADYLPASTANLFYWNNLLHDVLDHYGFDSAAGNFQVNTYGAGGNGGDDVRAEDADGGGINNANFLTPPDGQRPRMQMFVWNAATPDRSSSLDNLVISHEYAHGVSNRLVGGRFNVNCLQNAQQAGEGWSDYYGLAFTHEVGDTGGTGRGVGTYLLNQGVGGPGIRTQRYSTNSAINDHTYQSIGDMTNSHGVGEVWAQMLWELHWKLVNTYGFDPDLHNAGGGSGNQRALLYVTEGLRNTACSPTFVDARNGIIQAAVDNYAGGDVCAVWDVFANYGIGVDAVSGGAGSTSPTNGFATAAECEPWQWVSGSGNNGSGQIGLWNMNGGDRYIPGDFDGDGKDEVLAIATSGWAHLMRYSGTGWQWFWGNGGSGQIALWNMNPSDRYYAGDFDGDGKDELVSFSAGGWSHLARWNGTNWQWFWGNGGSGQVALWFMSPGDIFVPGDYDGDGADELLAFSTGGWSHLMQWESGSSNWSWTWGNGGSGQIALWNRGPGDRFYAANFTGDARDELLAISSTGWSHVMDWGGGNWNWKWGNGGTGQIALWNMGVGQQYIPGDFSGDGHDELVAMGADWHHLMRFDAGFQWIYGNRGIGRIALWNMSPFDRYWSGKFNGSDEDDLMAIGNNWTHLMEYTD